MPSPQHTDLSTLSDLFVDTIEAISPRYARGSQLWWRHTKREGPPGLSARVFRFEWDADFETGDGIIFPRLIDTTVPLAIHTDYGGVPDHESERMADVDSSQLREALHALCHTSPGLITVRKDDPPWEYRVRNDGDQAQISHLFLVRYWKQR